MPGERFVVLGLARPRAAWFSAVAQWATSAAVLVMAFLGAAMWLAFKAIFDDSTAKVQSNVNDIGS